MAYVHAPILFYKYIRFEKTNFILCFIIRNLVYLNFHVIESSVSQAKDPAVHK
jgi:hypothetical protein